MPAYNSGKYIKSSIESILQQTYDNWELIIVNDASTDETLSIIKLFSEKDSRIKIYSNESNMGLGFTTNRALSLSNGYYIARLDSDDLAQYNWLSQHITFLNSNPSFAAISGSRILIDSKGKIIKILNESINDLCLKYKLYYGNPVIHPGIVFRKNIGLIYNNFQYLEDWDLWVRMIKFGSICVHKNHLIFYRIHKNNTSSKYGGNSVNLIPIIREIRNNLKFNDFDYKLSDQVIWCLYRNRKIEYFNNFVVYRAIVYIVIHFNKILLENTLISKEERNNLNFYFWDNVVHILLSSEKKIKILKYIWKFNPIPFSKLFTKTYIILFVKLLFYKIYRVERN
jgi:glycosyltransferase involved in cell wall biosynthesis